MALWVNEANIKQTLQKPRPCSSLARGRGSYSQWSGRGYNCKHIIQEKLTRHSPPRLATNTRPWREVLSAGREVLSLLCVKSGQAIALSHFAHIHFIIVSSCMTTPIVNSCACDRPKGKSRSLLSLVCMTVVAYLLLLSGDVETNPGPQCKSV